MVSDETIVYTIVAILLFVLIVIPSFQGFKETLYVNKMSYQVCYECLQDKTDCLLYGTRWRKYWLQDNLGYDEYKSEIFENMENSVSCKQ